MTMYNARIERYNYRLSQIEEESDSLSVLEAEVAMEESFQKLNLNNEAPIKTLDGATSPIYCSTDKIVSQQHEEGSQMKDAVKKISDKYDSLERVQKHINNGTAVMAEVSDGFEDSQVPIVDVFEAITRPEQITESDISQVEMFYRSHQTSVTVCQALTNLYFGQARSDGSCENWELFRTGIPVLVLDSGEGRRRRKLHIVLAEKGTGFTLWKDQMDHLSSYKMVQPNFHTVFLSNDHTKLAGFSFDDAVAANDFLNAILNLTSDPTDEMLSTGRKKKDKNKKPKLKFKAPKKTDISQPCCFVHVTKLENNEDIFGSVPPPTRPRPPSMIQQLGSVNGISPVPTE